MISDKTQSPVRYPSDLTDEEWETLQPILEQLEPYTTGRPRTTDLREILNAIFYLNKTGCPWRYLPQDFPSYTTVNTYYNKWTDNQTLEKINTALRQHLREKKAELPTRQRRSLIVKASRVPRNRLSNRGSTGASLSREENDISFAIQWVA
ncbi:transposase [Candidatus Thiosymbion oneisti]|uniref:transposase n=2 Tax=Candidatus Thiosymbion oneisti TaxID=589554 RepID=UPI001FB831F3|nr:transposase [Candidatus Thiosymbion oneisti]